MPRVAFSGEPLAWSHVSFWFFLVTSGLGSLFVFSTKSSTVWMFHSLLSYSLTKEHFVAPKCGQKYEQDSVQILCARKRSAPLGAR